MDVSVRTLKNRLSEYLRRVQGGEEVHVTLRGERIARLVPERAASHREGSETEAVGRLRTMPWIRRGNGGQVLGSDAPIEWPDDQRPLSQEVMDDRE